MRKRFNYLYNINNIYGVINLANILTFLRIAFVPISVVLYYLQFQVNTSINWFNLALVGVFALAGFTDYLDGYFARQLHITSKFGAFLDPVADKLIVITALVLLIDYYHHFVVVLPALIIIIRELSISALREWMNTTQHKLSVVVSDLGRIKTSMQLLAILCLLYQQPFLSSSIYIIGIILFYIATIFTIWSAFNYFRKGLKIFDS